MIILFRGLNKHSGSKMGNMKNSRDAQSSVLVIAVATDWNRYKSGSRFYCYLLQKWFRFEFEGLDDHGSVQNGFINGYLKGFFLNVVVTD